MLNQSRLTRLVATLLGATALLFAIASSAERSSARQHKEPAIVPSAVASTPAASAAPSPAETTHDEAAEKSGGEGNTDRATEAPATRAESAPAAHVETSAERQSEGDLTFIGINLEAIGFIVLGATLSVALGALVWIKPSGPALVAAALFGAGFAVLDVVEARHQLKEARHGLALAAWVLFAAHLAITAAAAAAARTRTTG
ncbi:MAG: hypothetical protein ABI912_07360 [Actinomycetota bacterium]